MKNPILSGTENGCKDYCIYDSGHNCLFCERFPNTEYFKSQVNKIRLIRELEYLKLAIRNEPEGVFCGFCGDLNDFVDDAGFFYIMSPFDMYKIVLKPCCERCYYKYNSTHINWFGLGER